MSSGNRLEYPRDRDENILFREKLIRTCDNNVQMQEFVKEQFYEDILFAFNVIFWTYDPRHRPHHLPFITYPFQDEGILLIKDHIERGEDLLVDKSRDMGVSWMVTTVFLWHWLRPGAGNDFMLGSRKEPLVDKKGNLDTLMEKCRYNLYKLPDWLFPKGFNKNKHDNYLQLYNPESGCPIEGESTNEHFATGGRYKAVLFDEAAKWGETAEPAWVSAGDSTPCRVAVSTPYGMGTHFARLRFSKTTKVLSFHWTKHPLKAEGSYCDLGTKQVRSPWYDAECVRRAATPLSIGQELDIDYVTSGSPAFSTQYLKTLRASAGEVTPKSYNLHGGVWMPNENGKFNIIRKPRPDCQYAIGADAAEGVEGGDYCAAPVLNRHTMNIDAYYHFRTTPDHFAYDLMTLGYMYGGRDKDRGALLAIETNSIGSGTAIECDNQGYPNMYYHVNEHMANKKVTQRLGWLTTRMTKKVLVSQIESFLHDCVQFGYFVPLAIVDELLTFVVRGTRGEHVKYEADSGCNDDLVMSLGIALMAHVSSPLLPVTVTKVIGPHIIERDAKKAPSVHDRCMNTLRRKNLANIMDEHMGTV